MIVKTQQRQLETVQSSSDGGQDHAKKDKEALVVEFSPARRQEVLALSAATGRGSVHPAATDTSSPQDGRNGQAAANGSSQNDGPINKLRKRFGVAVSNKVRSPQRKMPPPSSPISTSSPSLLLSSGKKPEPLSLRDASTGTVRTDAAVYQGKPGSALASSGPNGTPVGAGPLRQQGQTPDRSPLRYIDNVYVVRPTHSPPRPRNVATAVRTQRNGEGDSGANATWTAFVDERQRRQQEQLGRLPNNANRALDPSKVSLEESPQEKKLHGYSMEERRALRQQQIRRHTYSMTAAGGTPERGADGSPVLLPTRTPPMNATTPSSARRTRRHERRNTDDTDMTPLTNNLTAALCPTPPKHWRNGRTHPLLNNGRKLRSKDRNAGPIDVDAVSITTSSSGASSNSSASGAVNEEDNSFLGRVYDMYVLNDSSDNEKEKEAEAQQDDVAMGTKKNAPSPASLPSPFNKPPSDKDRAKNGTPPLSPSRGGGSPEPTRQVSHEDMTQSQQMANYTPSSPRAPPPPILLNPVAGSGTPPHSPPLTPNRRRCNTTGSALTKEAIAQHESRYKEDGTKKRGSIVKTNQKKILGRSASFRMRSSGQPPKDQSPPPHERLNYRRQNSDRYASKEHGNNAEKNLVLDRWKREQLLVERWERHKEQQKQQLNVQGKKKSIALMNPPADSTVTRQDRAWSLGRFTGSSPQARRPTQQEPRPAEGRSGIGRWGGTVRNTFFFGRRHGDHNGQQQQQSKTLAPPLVGGGRRLKGLGGGGDSSPRANPMLVEADTGLEVIPFTEKGFVQAH